jgi:hypothetical protein
MYQEITAETLPELDVQPPARQRRLTVLLRLLLLIPQFIVLWVLGIVTFFAAIAAWFAALALGRLPNWAESYLSGYVAYTTRVYASMYLLVDSYPPFTFTAPDSPVRVELRPERLNRLAVFFRIILAIPAIIISSVITGGWQAVSFFCWLTVLIMGRTPEPLFKSTAAILRYEMRLQSYFLMLTPAYPKRLFGDDAGQGTAAPDTARVSGTHPLRLNTEAKVLLGVFILVGILGAIGSGFGSSSDNSTTTTSSTSARP